MVEQDILAALVLNLYKDKIKPGIMHENHFDLRAEMITATINYFKAVEQVPLISGTIDEIVSDLRSLMPTSKKIAASRDNSTKRFIVLASA